MKRLLPALVLVSVTACGLADDERDEENKYIYPTFSDKIFEAYCLGEFDLDGNGRISRYEAQRVVRIDYSGRGIASLADVAEFANLRELDCRGMREKCDEAGLAGIPLLVGGNIVVGKQDFADVEKRFKAMGFDRAFPPGTPPETTIAALREILYPEEGPQ